MGLIIEQKKKLRTYTEGRQVASKQNIGWAKNLAHAKIAESKEMIKLYNSVLDFYTSKLAF